MSSNFGFCIIYFFHSRNKETTNINYWDIFRKDVSEETLSTKSSVAERIFKIIKFIAYIFYFAIVFGGTIVSKASLQILTDQLRLERKAQYTVSK